MLLTRFAYHTSCTLGWLTLDELRLATIERPWLPNPLEPGGQICLSCVPEGCYEVFSHDTPRYPQTYALVNHTLGVYYLPKHVPRGQPWGRTAILIHAGSTVRMWWDALRWASLTLTRLSRTRSATRRLHFCSYARGWDISSLGSRSLLPGDPHRFAVSSLPHISVVPANSAATP